MARTMQTGRKTPSRKKVRNPQQPVPARGGPKLTDILRLVAMQGQADIVASVGLGLNRATWSDPDLWLPCINVVFGNATLKGFKTTVEITARTRLMIYIRKGKIGLIDRILRSPPIGYRADPNQNITVVRADHTTITVTTPLKCAIEKKLCFITSRLLELGADPNQKFTNDSSICIGKRRRWSSRRSWVISHLCSF